MFEFLFTYFIKFKVFLFFSTKKYGLFNFITKSMKLPLIDIHNLCSCILIGNENNLMNKYTNFLNQILDYDISNSEKILLINKLIEYGFPINEDSINNIITCIDSCFFEVLLELIKLQINIDINVDIKYKTNILFNILSSIKHNLKFFDTEVDMSYIFEIFRLLLNENKIDVNEQDFMGDTLIHILIEDFSIYDNINEKHEFLIRKNNFYINIFELLQDKNINFDLINNEGISARDIVYSLKYDEGMMYYYSKNDLKKKEYLISHFNI